MAEQYEKIVDPDEPEMQFAQRVSDTVADLAAGSGLPTPVALVKKIPAHPIVCWLSRLLACFGVRLDPFVEVKLPAVRTGLLFGDRLMVSPAAKRDMGGFLSSPIS